MKKICLYFQVHQPYRLKKYRFFNIGKDHFYFDDFLNRTIIDRIAADCYKPMNELIIRMAEKYRDQFKVSFSISGSAIEQFQTYAPEVLEQFKKMADTGCVEFLTETYAHSLSALKNGEEFKAQVEKHSQTIERLFGQRPTVFRNTELIYSDHIGELVNEMGYETILTEGTKHILGWKSPNFLYSNPIKQKLKLLLRNFKLSDDIAFRFGNKGWSEYPLTAGKYFEWLKNNDDKGEIVNLFMDYETFGEHVKAESGIFEFMEDLIGQVVQSPETNFMTPSEIARECQSVSLLHVPHPISWADEERDLTAWLGNELQDEAISKLYALRPQVEELARPEFEHVWMALQASDHFYYMCTKWFADGDVHQYFNPYDSPYEAFMNYMNVLSDFTREVQRHLAEKNG